MSYKKYRETLEPIKGSDCYPMDCRRVLNLWEKIWAKEINWNKYIAVDACCDKNNMRYPVGLTEHGVISDRWFPNYMNVDHNQNSLFQPWSKFGKYIWCGAPYSTQKDWISKCINESRKGAVVAGLFAWSPNRPQKWIEQRIFNKYFCFDAGRLASGYWKRPPWNNLLVIFGINKNHQKLYHELEKWKEDFNTRIELAKVKKRLCYNEGPLLEKYCRELGIVTTIGNLPIKADIHGKRVILYSEYQKIKKYINDNSNFNLFFKE